MGTQKNLVPALVGFGITLVGVYILVFVASKGFKAGQK
jgi:hypothetical protein